MSNEPTASDWSLTPETTQVPVQGNCGHVFTVPIARIQDGAEFSCPVCGQADRFNDEDRKATQEELAELDSKEGGNAFAKRLGNFLMGKRDKDKSAD